VEFPAADRCNSHPIGQGKLTVRASKEPSSKSWQRNKPYPECNLVLNRQIVFSIGVHMFYTGPP